MKIYDVTGCTAEIVRPGMNLTKWAEKFSPYALCNASLYSGVSTVTPPTRPVGTIIENGTLVSNQGNGFGCGIEAGKDTLDFGQPWDRTWEDYLTGYNAPVQDGVYIAPGFTDSYVFPNRLARIGIGKKHNRIYIVTDDNVTLREFALDAIADGFDTLVNLDGGASRHLLYDSKTVYTSARIPYNAIAFFKGDKKEEDTSSMKYIDVSQWQGEIDWAKVKGNVDGVIIRAGSGSSGTADKYFARNASECNRLGIPCGAYWFSYAKSVAEAEKEAKHLLAAVKPYRMELPLAFDFENDSADNAKHYGVNVTKAFVSSLIRAFCTTIENGGYWALNYTNPDFLSRLVDDSVTARFGLWLASWPTAKVFDKRKPPRTCAIWQWGTSTIPGISGVVDTNEAFQDFKTLITKAGLNRLNVTYDDGEGGTITEHTAAQPTQTQSVLAADALKWAQGAKITDDPDIALALWRYHNVFHADEDERNRGGAVDD